jgi:sarcosine oxidase subunit gamma
LGVAAGLKLPTTIGAFSADSSNIAMKLGPDEWLLIASEGSGLVGRINAVAGHLFSAVDVSHRNTAIIVEGEKAAAAINAGCPRDLSLAAFPVGACARTLLAKSEIVLAREAESRFRVECWRSFSDYVWNYLADAARSA